MQKAKSSVLISTDHREKSDTCWSTLKKIELVDKKKETCQFVIYLLKNKKGNPSFFVFCILKIWTFYKKSIFTYHLLENLTPTIIVEYFKSFSLY